MQIPVRLAALLRPSVAPGILLAVGFNTIVLAATPFLLDLVVDEYGVSLTEASLIGVAQLSGFSAGSWLSGRWLEPRRRVFVIALVLALAANALSALVPPFAVLVALRLLSGLALGLITWFAWVQVFGDETGMGDLAVIGPLIGIGAGPLIALFAVEGGTSGVFALLAAAAVIPLAFNRGTGGEVAGGGRSSGRSRPVPAALVLLLALALFTLGGSAVFQYAVIIGAREAGLATSTVALVLSGNALASIPAARWRRRRGIPGPWMALTALCALLVAASGRAEVFTVAIVVWGFAFWMGIPGVFTALAERSANPADRAGDAQAVMAAGRVVGPLVGGAILDSVGTGWLGIVGGGLMLVAAGAVYSVRRTSSFVARTRAISALVASSPGSGGPTRRPSEIAPSRRSIVSVRSPRSASHATFRVSRTSSPYASSTIRSSTAAASRMRARSRRPSRSAATTKGSSASGSSVGIQAPLPERSWN